MKAIIYNVGGDSDEWLKYSLATTAACFDLVVIVWSDYNWYDENVPCKHLHKIDTRGFLMINFKGLGRTARAKQLSKKQKGIDEAYRLGCTHYMLADSDELWEPDKLKEELKEAEKFNISVAPLDTYYMKPYLRLAKRERYYVPFLCSLPATLSDKAKYMNYICDPTRKKINNENKCYVSNTAMQHYSWIREDIFTKVKSHSGRKRLVNNFTIQQDMQDANNGNLSYSRFYDCKLVDDMSNQDSFYNRVYRRLLR